MPQIKKEWYDQLIIVDGGSTDGTIEYIKEQGYPYFVQNGKGSGAAFTEAMQRATGDIFIAFSPDGNSLSERIPDAINKIKEGYDIVIVSRYLDGAKSYDDDLVTAFGNRFFTGLINFLYGGNITDSLVMFRAYRKSVIDELNICTQNNSWGSQILLRAIKNKLRIAEVPGDEPPRIGGERKMRPLKNGFNELRMILKEFFIRELR